MPIIVEISTDGSATACTEDGQEIAGSDYQQDLEDCCTSGDCSEACEYVLDQVGVEFRIVKQDANGKYGNFVATPEDKAAACREIYFESDTDFTDERTAETYLVWQAASDIH